MEDKLMYKYKGTLTEDELILISRYPDDIQDKLKDKLLEAKEMTKSFSYDKWIEHMELGLVISFKENTTFIGELNTARLARLLLQINDGKTRKPSLQELGLEIHSRSTSNTCETV
jgi:hypothetical protein